MNPLLTDVESTLGRGKEVAYIRCSFDDPAVTIALKKEDGYGGTELLKH